MQKQNEFQWKKLKYNNKRQNDTYQCKWLEFFFYWKTIYTNYKNEKKNCFSVCSFFVSKQKIELRSIVSNKIMGPSSEFQNNANYDY